MNSKLRRTLVLLFLLPSVLAGCTLVQLRSEAKEFYGASVLVGRVWAADDWQGPVVVVAATSIDGRAAIAHQVLLHEPGSYELIVPDGEYTLLAYGDADRDGAPDDQAPAGILPATVSVEGTRLISLLDFPLSRSRADDVRRALPSRSAPPPAHSTQVGAIANLDAEAFSSASGSRGYWSPLESFRAVGGNIYFLEPYDPARTPVLFVHGAAGSAQDWRHFFEHIDRSRYQAWFFQYPSGAPLESMSHLLYWKLLNARVRYGFERLHVVAHSMGGLVARRFLLDHGDRFPQIDQFITLSTPWSGEALARLGVEHSPAVVPSWRDMQPEGPFLKTLFDRPLWSHVDHSLLFGHRGGYNLARPTSDGTVTLASQLRPEAQSGARLVMGFDEDHVGILASAQVLDVVSTLLDSANASAAVDTRLRVELSFADGRAGAGGIPSLVLEPVRSDSSERGPALLVPLPAARGIHDLGFIPPGEYATSLSAAGFRSSPRNARVRIERGSAQRLAFDLVPEGSMTGVIVSEADTIAHPAGSYRAPEHALEIQEISLEGPSGRRVIVPRAAPSSASTATCLGNQDEALGACFSFVDLSAGEYVLTVVAKGYQRHTSRHHIEPGTPTPSTAVVLRRERRPGSSVAR